jgi:hypothetical protein
MIVTIIALGTLIIGGSGFIGAALLFGDPPAKNFWLGALIVGFAVGIPLTEVGARRARRKLGIDVWRTEHRKPEGVETPDAGDSDERAPSEQNRRILLALSVALIVLIAAQVLLFSAGDNVATAVVGLACLVYIASVFLWVYRARLFHHERRRTRDNRGAP